jgi:hypothetical protein
VEILTKCGLRLPYPNAKRYHLLPLGWRITTGSQAEDLVAALLLLPVLLPLLQANGAVAVDGSELLRIRE